MLFVVLCGAWENEKGRAVSRVTRKDVCLEEEVRNSSDVLHFTFFFALSDELTLLVWTFGGLPSQQIARYRRPYIKELSTRVVCGACSVSREGNRKLQQLLSL